MLARQICKNLDIADMLEGGKDTGQQGQTLAQKLESVYKEEEDAAARCVADSALDLPVENPNIGHI